MSKFLILFCSVLVISCSLFFGVYRVDGRSMEPQIENGSLVIIKRNLLHSRRTEVDDIVMFKSPLTEKLNIKRCAAVDDERIFVTGINLPESTDSRHFGSIPESEVQGWVWIKI